VTPYCAIVLRKQGGEVFDPILKVLSIQLSEFPSRVDDLIAALKGIHVLWHSKD
jgi:hypothetical protein